MSFGNNQRSGSKSTFEEKLRARRKQNLYRFVLILVVVGIIALIVGIQYRNHVYTSYDIMSSVTRDSIRDIADVRLGNNFLSYSKDGAHCTDAKGNILWNQTYEIQDIRVAINKGTVAIANYNGREIYVLNENSPLCNISTTLPVRNVAVSQNGYTTVVSTDTDVTWIDTYDSEGNQIYNGKTHMSNSGYPIAVALSPSASMLAVSYMYVDAGVVKSTIAFYNMGAIGDNYMDSLVSGRDYTDLVIPEIGFLSDGCFYAVGDGRLILYTGEEKPAQKAEYLFDQEVLSVYSGNGYVGVIFTSEQADSRYKMDVYNASGNKQGTYYFNMEYSDVVFEKNDFIIYNEGQCLIKTYDNRVKFDGDFLSSVKTLIPTGSSYKYVLVGDTSINTIQLK